jgi:D-cysteine desulfhydrase
LTPRAQALEALARIPRLSLGRYPTDVERCGAFGPAVWVKRDDLAGDPPSGNKLRALEFLLADAQCHGRRSLLTAGGSGSNWIAALAVHARRIGVTVEALVFAQPDTLRVHEVQRLLAAWGVRQRRGPIVLLPLLAVAPLLRGARPLPPGGASALGALGHVVAGLEFCDQVAAGELPDPHEIYVPLGSGGTTAGLALGLALGGSRARLIAVRVADRPVANARRVAELARGAARLLGVDPHTAPVEIAHGQFGGRYGRPTPAAEEAVRHAAAAGLSLETTYTGKALAELLARRPAGPTVFWNTFDSRTPAPP